MKKLTQNALVEDIIQTMNTVVQLKVEGNDRELALAKAKIIILGYGKRFNFFSPESEISKLCTNIRRGQKYDISEELYEILEIAKEVKNKTGGLFDVDYANKDNNKGYELDRSSISFESTNTKINLGAIAKGFAADRAMGKIKELDVERAMISMGGQISCFSKNKPWRVGLQNPNEDFGQLIGTMEIANGTLSTSAENYRGEHIVNPTDNAWKRSVKSISVFSESGIVADAYSTALFLADEETRKKIVQRMGLNVIIVDGDVLKISAGLRKRFALIASAFKVEKY